MMRHAYRAHRREVDAHLADRPDDLLVLDVFGGDGRPELCAFLDLPVPTTPFPKLKPGAPAPSPPTRGDA